MILSGEFEEALVYAAVIHAGQVRKGTDVPYFAHLLGVASIALEYEANETEATAALLHDAVEDAGGKGRLEDIRQRFGEAVAEIVAGCTDTDVIPKPPWRERKEAYVRHISTAPPSVRLVSAADKLYNARHSPRLPEAGRRAVEPVQWRQGRNSLVLPVAGGSLSAGRIERACRRIGSHCRRA